MKRVIRDRHLTSEEVAKYNAVRDEIEAEKPEINARIRARIAAKRGAEVRVVKLDASQARFCGTTSDRVRLLAPAGSGKTQSLLWRCNDILQRSAGSSPKFLIFTFTRAARDELVARIHGDPEFALLRGSVRVDTLNRWGNSYLRNLEAGLVVKSQKSDMYFLVNNTLRPLWSKSATLKKALATKRQRYPDLIDVVSTLKTCGFRHDGEDLIADFRAHLEWLDQNGLARFFEANVLDVLDSIGLLKSGTDTVGRISTFLKFWAKACDHLWSSAILTLDDQKYWALLKLQEKYPDTHFPEPNRYHHIFVDEFQDVNPLDISLVRELVRVNNSTFTIVGDDDQAIFEWRGATPAFIVDPNTHLGGSFETHTLEVNYRCPRNIVRLSQSLIANNRNRVPKTVRAARHDDATILVEALESHDNAVEYVLELARGAAETGMPKALAVLARKKSQLLPLEIMLTSEEIPFYVKEDLNVLLSHAFGELKTVLEAVAMKDQRLPTHQVVSQFIECCNKVQAYPLKTSQRGALYANLMKGRPKTFRECLCEFQAYEGSVGSHSSSDAALRFAMPIARVLEATTVAAAMDLIEEHMVGLQRHYSKAEDDVFYKDPPFLYLGEYAQRYGDRFFDFIDHVENAIAQMIPQGPDDDSTDDDLALPVHLMTALRAKGKEFETVVVLDANDGIWPIRHAESEAELEQERRLFYVAITRAQKKLVLLPVAQLAGHAVQPTPYIEEMGLAGPM